MSLKISIDDDLNGLWFFLQGDGGVLKVVLKHVPRLLPVLLLFARPVDFLLSLGFLPVG